jgi:acyl carrier protein
VDVFGTLKEILIGKFQVPAELITPETTRDEADLDSLLMVELSLVLEREIGVVVSHHDLHDTDTVGEMVDLIAKHASSPA